MNRNCFLPYHLTSGVMRFSEAMQKIVKNCLPLLLIVLLSSCRTSDRITYFQDADLLPDTLMYSQSYAKIQPHDELRIIVSAENSSAVAAFNKPMFSERQTGELNLNAQSMLQTYVVNSKGTIDFPTLGEIQVAGITTEELTELLKTRIKDYVQNPIVSIDPIGVPVLMLGEVNSPGVLYLQSNRTNLIDAIARAHDLTIYGNRESVLIIHRDGDKQIKHRVNLSSIDSLEDPLCVLHQNDIVYVAPNDARRASSRYNSMKQQNLSLVSTIVSVVSVLTSLAIALWK